MRYEPERDPSDPHTFDQFIQVYSVDGCHVAQFVDQETLSRTRDMNDVAELHRLRWYWIDPSSGWFYPVCFSGVVHPIKFSEYPAIYGYEDMLVRNPPNTTQVVGRVYRTDH